MTVDVVVPWADTGCSWRARALAATVKAWRPWAAAHGGTIVVAEAATAGEWGEWRKADRVVEGLRRSGAGVVAVVDADVVCGDPGAGPENEVLAAVESGRAAWGRPHGLVARLSQRASERVHAGEWPSVGFGLDEPLYHGVDGGGVVIGRRDVLLGCPPDRRFVGWGHEDVAWAQALRCLHGEPWRGAGTLFHLWHPPQERASRSKGSEGSWALAARYRAARRDRSRMRALVDEGSVR